MTGESADGHRAWALAERRQTNGILFAFLVSRMSEEKALARMAEVVKSYPQLPRDSGAPE
jgi:hypothetical protein